ncbi:MAG: hypothetical protein GXO09_04020 [Crenarchaeota archaeon]|nr:hypothetical protein [Thermoproteota archaeon]
MTLIPSVDVEGSRAVKRVKGLRGTGLVLGDPVEAAEKIYALGYRAVHLVDLDSAGRRRPRSYALRLIRALSCGIGFEEVEYGGGVGSREAVSDVASAGASRIIIGSAWLRDPGFAAEASEEARAHGSVILLAAEEDRDGFLLSRGWTRRTPLRVEDAVRTARDCGAGVFYTQVWREGLLEGPCGWRAEHVRSISRGLTLIYSGGVSCDADVELLESLGFDGVVAGMAFYTGRLTVERWARSG